MTLPHPAQQFFSIGEVCALTDLKPHVLRYWESQFRFLNPAKNRSGNRVYKSRDVELVMLVKHLLYSEKFTIDGARQRLDHYRKTGELKTAARQAMRYETVRDIERALADIDTLLSGGTIPVRPEPQDAAPASGPPAPVPGRVRGGAGGEQLSLA
jgi:DNA-binding transcriptional MerR regulator